jgi:hypothetical protein
MDWQSQLRWRSVILHYAFGIDAEWNWVKSFEKYGTVEEMAE